MEKFDERKKSFEKKFAHDEELKFKVASRRNKYLGQWASKKLGYDENKEKEYIQSVIKADFQEAGDEDVFRKIQADLKGHNISDDDIRNKMKEFYKYFKVNNKIRDLEFNHDFLEIFSKDILKKIKNNEKGWQDKVPKAISKMIVKNKMFGYK